MKDQLQAEINGEIEVIEPETFHEIHPGAHRATCPECGRTFDLLDEDQAEEFYYGHDCEAS